LVVFHFFTIPFFHLLQKTDIGKNYGK
jgi:hypothetical protein